MRQAIFRLRFPASLGLVALVLMAAKAPAQNATPDLPFKGDQASQKRWTEGLAALSHGRFDQANRLIHGVAVEAGADPHVTQIDKWLAEFDRLQTERAQRRQADYDKYVSWAREEAGKELWSQVIVSMNLAFNNAEDEDAFRNEPWVKEFAEKVAAAAQAREDAKEWFKAATMYARLADIFPHDKTYRKELERCQAHLRLRFTYAPDVKTEKEKALAPKEAPGEDLEPPDMESDWQALVSDIVPSMARDAFNKIDTDYLKKPVFKEAVIAGLEQILLTVNEPELAEVFPGLKNEREVADFCERVNVRLRFAQRSEELTVHDLNAYFDRLLKINEENNLLPENVLIYEFVHGALKPLDKFSDMIWPSDVAEFNKHTQGRFSGVGIQIRKDYGEPIRVISPLEDTPAYRAGIQPGDMITRIGGKPAAKFSITGAVREITGPPGTSVTLTIRREGLENEFDVELTRQEITITTIKGFERDASGQWKYMIDPQEGIGYARLTSFTETSIDELRDVLTALKKEGLRGLIFDLRANPGGQLKSAVDVSDLFLDGEKRIVSTKDRRDKDWVMSVSDNAHFADFPMIVLVNGISASASEIVTGALQVHHRALVVGERTFGKGSVQQVLRINNSNQAFLKLTTALYYLPNDRCLHRDDDSVTWGVDPDVQVKLVPKEMIKANELRLKTDILRGRNQKELTEDDLKGVMQIRPHTQPADAGDSPSTAPAAEEDIASTTQPADVDEDGEEVIVRTDPNEFPEIDPQLDAALLLMRVRLESNQPWERNAAGVAAAAGNVSGG